MIQADKDFMMDWCGYVSRDVRTFANVIEADQHDDAVFVENVGYQFARMALYNLGKVCIDETDAGVLSFNAAMGMMRACGEALAEIDPNLLMIPDERKN